MVYPMVKMVEIIKLFYKNNDNVWLPCIQRMSSWTKVSAVYVLEMVAKSNNTGSVEN